MNWNFDNERPIYLQIIEHIKLFIVTGEFLPGQKLASVRELASEAGVNPNTMQKALSELENTGLVYSNRTSGRYVTDNPDLINSVREEMAKKNIVSFLLNMEQIGITLKDSIELIQKFYTGGTQK